MCQGLLCAFHSCTQEQNSGTSGNNPNCDFIKPQQHTKYHEQQYKEGGGIKPSTQQGNHTVSVKTPRRNNMIKKTKTQQHIYARLLGTWETPGNTAEQNLTNETRKSKTKHNTHNIYNISNNKIDNINKTGSKHRLGLRHMNWVEKKGHLEAQWNNIKVKRLETAKYNPHLKLQKNKS